MQVSLPRGCQDVGGLAQWMANRWLAGDRLRRGKTPFGYTHAATRRLQGSGCSSAASLSAADVAVPYAHGTTSLLLYLVQLQYEVQVQAGWFIVYLRLFLHRRHIEASMRHRPIEKWVDESYRGSHRDHRIDVTAAREPEQRPI